MSTTSRAASPRIFAALMGAFGVAMGFAAFVLLQEQTLGERTAPATFLLGLLAASLTSFAIESVRERAEGHTKGGAADPGRVLGLLVLLAIFEVYVSGAEEVVKLLAGGHGGEFLNGLFSEGISEQLGILPQLVVFGGLWVVLGGVAAWSVLHEAPATPTNSPAAPDTPVITSVVRSAMFPGLRRVGLGLLLIAIVSLAYVLLMRLVLTVAVLIVRPQDYAPDFLSLLPETGSGTGNTLGMLPILLAGALEQLAHAGRWGGVALLGAAGSLAFLFLRIVRRASTGFGLHVAAITLGGALILLALGPFATSSTQFTRLLRIVAASTAIWLAPLVVLAVAIPRLSAPSRSPKLWGIAAFCVALGLVLVTWDRLSQPPAPLFVTSLVVALVVTGWIFVRGADVVQFWPLVALTLAVAAFEGSSVLQRLTFLSTFKEAALLQSSPITGGGEARERAQFRRVTEWRKAGEIDSAVAALVDSIEQIPLNTPPSQVNLMAQRTTRAADDAFGAALAQLCRPSGTPVLDTLHRDITAWCARARELSSPTVEQARALWQGIGAVPEPWDKGLSGLIEGASDDAISQAFEFRWSSPDSEQSREMASRVARVVAREDRYADPALQLARTMVDSSLTPTTRLWLVMDALARSDPPGPTVTAWMTEREGNQINAALADGGLPVATVLLWWYPRRRHLAELVEARYLAGVPTDRPLLRLNGRVLPLTRHESELRALTALRLANERLVARQRAVDEGAALEANPRAAIILELSLGASFAFWATAGLLAGLAKREHAQHALTKAATNGPETQPIRPSMH